jgi:hypothetical protein
MTDKKKPSTPKKPPAEPAAKVKIKPDLRISKIVDRNPSRPTSTPR